MEGVLCYCCLADLPSEKSKSDWNMEEGDLTKAELEAALCSEKGGWTEKLDENYTHANIKNLVYH